MPNRGTLALLSVSAPLAWAGLAYTVFNISPDGIASRVLFFALLYVATLGTFGLAAYFASFRIFASKMHRGDVAGATQQGVIVATFLLIVAVLQAMRALSIMAALILLIALAVAELVIWRRRV